MALHDLQELDQDEDRPEDAETEGEAHEVRNREAAIAEQPEGQERRGRSRFPDHEGDEEDSSADERSDDLEAVPADRVAADDPVDEPEEPEAGEQESHDVGPHAFAEAVRQREQHQGNRDDAERHIQPEDRLPVPALHDGASDKGTECDPEARDASPDADGGRAETHADGAGEESERQRHECCRADALDCASRDQHPRFGREGAERRGDGEDDDAGEEDAAPAEAVAEGDGHEHHRREREGVGVHYPLQVFDGRRQVAGDDRQGAGDHEVVECRHEHREGCCDDGEPEGHAPGG